MTTTVHFCPGCGLRFVHMAELVDHMRVDHRAHQDAPATPTWGHVVVPLDPSVDTTPAMEVASMIARQAGMGLALVTVQGGGLDAVATEAFLRDRAFNATQAGVEECTWHRLPPGDVAGGILDVVDSGDATMVCMATHSRGAVGEMVLGSVSEAVVRSSPVPVVLVGPHAKAPTSPYAHLVVAVDGSRPGEAAIDVAAAMAPRLGADVTLVQVLQPDLVIPPDVSEDAYLRRAAGRLPASRTSWEVIHDRRPEHGIAAMTAAIPDALVVIGTHGRSGLRRLALGSVALAVVKESTAPVVVVGAPDVVG